MVSVTRDFIELLASLKAREVRFVIVGAHALAFHAKPRYTKDLDVLVEPTPENAHRILQALSDFGFSELGLDATDFTPGAIIQLGYEPARIDLITRIDGPSFQQVWDNRVPGKLGDEQVDFISRTDLIQNKQAAGRAQDLADLETLLGAEGSEE